MNKRINVMMPAETIRSVDRLSKPGERSKFITNAVEHFVATQSAEAIHKLLEMTAVRDRDLDRQVAEDWLAVDQQAWQHIDKPEQRPSAVKSTSRRSTRP
jgi:CopG family transcriptional regulator / antitoxin EndoAI